MEKQYEHERTRGIHRAIVRSGKTSLKLTKTSASGTVQLLQKIALDPFEGTKAVHFFRMGFR